MVSLCMKLRVPLVRHIDFEPSCPLTSHSPVRILVSTSSLLIVMCGGCIVLEVSILGLGFAYFGAEDIPIFFFLGIDLFGLACSPLFGEAFRFSMSDTFPAFDVYAILACLAGIGLFLCFRF